MNDHLNAFTLELYTSAIPYYGGKSKVAGRYPKPRHDRIIEPFAGGASYSLRYYERDVYLNDLNGPTAGVWRFLIGGDESLELLEGIPYDVKPGTPLTDLVRDDDPQDFKWFVQAHMGKGAFGMKGHRKRVSPFGAAAWSSSANGAGGLRDKAAYWIPKLKHWQITEMDFNELENETATWFVDPPYNNAAGRKYAKSAADIDFPKLAAWCRSRKGQVLACENNGSNWLEFQELTAKRNGIYCPGVTSTVGEAVYEQGGEVGLFDE